jgi:hypothetical protein
VQTSVTPRYTHPSRGRVEQLPGDWRDDFTTPSNDHNKDVQSQGRFIHEAFHIWQEQVAGLDLRAAAVALGIKSFFSTGGFEYGDDAYKYSLDNNNIDSLNFEQQAALMEDRYRVRNGSPPIRDLGYKKGDNLRTRSDAYDKTLSGFDQDNKYMKGYYKSSDTINPESSKLASYDENRPTHNHEVAESLADTNTVATNSGEIPRQLAEGAKAPDGVPPPPPSALARRVATDILGYVSQTKQMAALWGGPDQALMDSVFPRLPLLPGTLLGTSSAALRAALPPPKREPGRPRIVAMMGNRIVGVIEGSDEEADAAQKQDDDADHHALPSHYFPTAP